MQDNLEKLYSLEDMYEYGRRCSEHATKAAKKEAATLILQEFSDFLSKDQIIKITSKIHSDFSK